MATIRILLGIICLTFAGGFVKPGSDFLTGSFNLERLRSLNVVERTALSSTSKRTTKDEKRLAKDEERIAKQETDSREQILGIATSQLGIREATSNNDGIRVEEYLAYTGNKRGEPWCASFVSWVFGQAGFKQPKTAWSPALFPKNKQVCLPKQAGIFGIYFPKLKRVGHCGLISKTYKNWIYTIEGNTNPGGSREGDGVYQRIRHQRNISVYADWLEQKGGQP